MFHIKCFTQKSCKNCNLQDFHMSLICYYYHQFLQLPCCFCFQEAIFESNTVFCTAATVQVRDSLCVALKITSQFFF